jgi:hypothetical protein
MPPEKKAPPSPPPDEFANWQDGGCRYHPKCLECPFDICKLEISPRHERSEYLKSEAKRLKAKGRDTAQIARRLRRSVRSVEHYLKE